MGVRRLAPVFFFAMGVISAAPVAKSPPENFDLAQLTAQDVFTPERGYGFDLGTHPDSPHGFYFSVTEPEGNYRVTIAFGNRNQASDTTVKAESRQLMLQRVVTRAGETATRSFVVNIRTPRLPPPPKIAPGGDRVLLNSREIGLLRWDEKLTLEFDGPSPRVSKITIEPVVVPVIYLVGDSTVTDQPSEPGASWGQMLPNFFRDDIAVANHAESGETLKSFLTELRLAKVLSQIQAGDFLFIQFAHNDEKKSWPQTYAAATTTFRDYLHAYIDEARLRGATPVLVTPMQRRTFDTKGKITNSHGDYPESIRAVAKETGVACIDLDRMSSAFYEALGPNRAPLAFSQQGRDATHHDNYGAFELARCVVQGIQDAHLPLVEHLRDPNGHFDPAYPDSPDSFVLPASPGPAEPILRGN